MGRVTEALGYAMQLQKQLESNQVDAAQREAQSLLRRVCLQGHSPAAAFADELNTCTAPETISPGTVSLQQLTLRVLDTLAVKAKPHAAEQSIELHELEDAVVSSLMHEPSHLHCNTCTTWNRPVVKRRVHNIISVLTGAGLLNFDRKSGFVSFQSQCTSFETSSAQKTDHAARPHVDAPLFVRQQRDAAYRRVHQKSNQLTAFLTHFSRLRALMRRNCQHPGENDGSSPGIALPLFTISAPKESTVDVDVSTDEKTIDLNFHGYVAHAYGVH